MTRQEKAEAILHKIGEMINAREQAKALPAIAFYPDWDDWTATIETKDGHTHIGNMSNDNFDTFVDGLFNLLCEGEGLSFAQVQPTLEEKEIR